MNTACLFTKLWFYLHPLKSVSIPNQILTFPGFVLSSVEMTEYPTPQMVEKTVQACRQILSKGRTEILEVARLIGIIISNLQGAQFGLLHHRPLEHDKPRPLVPVIFQVPRMLSSSIF